MKLVYVKTGQPVKVGDKAKTFRGDEVEIEVISPPAHPGSTGRVDVVFPNGDRASFYPGVIDAGWIENGTAPSN